MAFSQLFLYSLEDSVASKRKTPKRKHTCVTQGEGSTAATYTRTEGETKITLPFRGARRGAGHFLLN